MKPPERAPADRKKAPDHRAFELDALRGLAIVLMILHHFAFDLRYLFAIPVFAFQESLWFTHLLRPLFVALFLVISGVCCTFSRNNLRRGARMSIAAAALTLVSVAGSWLLDEGLYIFTNVIHLVALGTLLFAALERRDQRYLSRRPWRVPVSLLLGAALLYWGGVLPAFAPVKTDWLLPLGLVTQSTAETMADYLPILPWLGFFFTGAAAGLVLYQDKKTLFPLASARLSRPLAPLTFVGRHALVFYVAHQPVLLGGLYLLRAARVI